MRHLLFTMTLIAFIAPARAETSATSEFLRWPEDRQTAYVAGVLQGVSYLMSNYDKAGYQGGVRAFRRRASRQLWWMCSVAQRKCRIQKLHPSAMMRQQASPAANGYANISPDSDRESRLPNLSSLLFLLLSAQGSLPSRSTTLGQQLSNIYRYCVLDGTGKARCFPLASTREEGTSVSARCVGREQ